MRRLGNIFLITTTIGTACQLFSQDISDHVKFIYNEFGTIDIMKSLGMDPKKTYTGVIYLANNQNYGFKRAIDKPIRRPFLYKKTKFKEVVMLRPESVTAIETKINAAMRGEIKIKITDISIYYAILAAAYSKCASESHDDIERFDLSRLYEKQLEKLAEHMSEKGGAFNLHNTEIELFNFNNSLEKWFEEQGDYTIKSNAPAFFGVTAFEYYHYIQLWKVIANLFYELRAANARYSCGSWIELFLNKAGYETHHFPDTFMPLQWYVQYDNKQNASREKEEQEKREALKTEFERDKKIPGTYAYYTTCDESILIKSFWTTCPIFKSMREKAIKSEHNLKFNTSPENFEKAKNIHERWLKEDYIPVLNRMSAIWKAIKQRLGIKKATEMAYEAQMQYILEL